MSKAKPKPTRTPRAKISDLREEIALLRAAVHDATETSAQIVAEVEAQKAHDRDKSDWVAHGLARGYLVFATGSDPNTGEQMERLVLDVSDTRTAFALVTK